MKFNLFLTSFFFFFHFLASSQMVQFYDAETKEPVSFATVSFGNGLGTHANAQGEFLFLPKQYAQIDTLYITALGYKNLTIATSNIKNKYALEQEIDKLNEVIVVSAKKRPYKKQEIKPISHNQYHDSWLQTIGSEIAVLFKKWDDKPTQISKLLLPINVKEAVDGKDIHVNTFTTLMRVKFYQNDEGLPGKELPYGTIVFVITEKENKNVFELDVSQNNIYIPQNGIFASIQVLGPADAKGQLIQTKTYNEYETPRGLKRIAISFRPLLPLTNQIAGEKTMVRRLFFNDKKWQVFDFTFNPNSVLLKKGFNNYGMGAQLLVYKE